MSPKKNILIVIDSLGNGGAEKSLINLLSFIDFSRFDVDLLMFGRGGINEKYLPSEVNILPVAEPAVPAGIINRVLFCTKRALYSASLRILPPKTSNDDAKRLWHFFAKNFKTINKHYDVALAYAQRLPTMLVAEKVNASRKYCWMNVTIHHAEEQRKYYSRFFNCFNGIVGVSDTVTATLHENYPQFADRIMTIYDIVNPEFITRLSHDECELSKKESHTNILTVARLDFAQKGYDILLQVCARLKRDGERFHWYALGNGSDKSQIERLIQQYDISDCFTLLGIRSNPYPYYINSDIYVQTSRYEGFGLSIAEARLLNVPVVTTPYDCVDLQMKDGVNGFVTTYEIEDIADAIRKLIHDKSLYNKVVDNLKQEKKGNVEEFQKILNLLEV